MTQSRTDVVCELAACALYGELLPYDLLAEQMGLSDPADRDHVRSAVNRARPRLERDHRRTLVVVPAVGYRVAEPHEHLALSRQHVRKARRSITRGHSKLANVDFAALDEQARQRFAEEEIALAALQAEVDRTRRRQLRRDRTV